jgi:hypothetical protein
VVDHKFDEQARADQDSQPHDHQELRPEPTHLEEPLEGHEQDRPTLEQDLEGRRQLLLRIEQAFAARRDKALISPMAPSRKAICAGGRASGP